MIRELGEDYTVALRKAWLEVPGGVVAHESEEFDGEGRLARRSKLQLVGYSGEFLPTLLR